MWSADRLRNNMSHVVLIAHNLRSAHNVGSLLRTADGLGINRVYLTGYTPHPLLENDERLPHLAAKIDKQIHKTALGAEHTQVWKYEEDILIVLQTMRDSGFMIYGLEQTATARRLSDVIPPERIAVIVGNEVSGLDEKTLQLCDEHIVIPMKGQKESFNVVQAAAMCLYHLTNVSLANQK